MRAAAIGLVVAIVAATASAQAPLPPEARMQVLLVQVDEALSNKDNKSALALFSEIDALKTVARPPGTYIIEAKLAGQEKDFARSMRTLEAYFRAANSSHPDYKEAAALYATLEGMQKEVDAKAAAAKAEVDAKAALARAAVEAEAAAAKVKMDAEAATRKSQNDVRVAAAALAAREGRPVEQRTFQDQLADAALGPTLIAVPPGSFLMGSPKNEKGRDNDMEAGPQVKVTISRALAFGKYEVTRKEYTACMQDGGCSKPRNKNLLDDQDWGTEDDRPARVSWPEAKTYTAWLTKRSGHRYRLPSEAEWEYAARAGTTTRFSWGDQDPICTPRATNGAFFEKCRSPDMHYAPVGTFAPNAFGLYDVHGNAGEMVEDRISRYVELGPRINGGAVMTADEFWLKRNARNADLRVVRSGASHHDASEIRSAARALVSLAGYYDTEGFRVVREIP